jgi:hypothetical protein
MSEETFIHYFYCYKHDDGFIVKSKSINEPKIPKSIKCEPTYEGLTHKGQKWYDSCNGGWKIEYFTENIYIE